MALLNIDQERCNQDGICAAVCPARIIEFEKGGYPIPVAGAENACIACGHCVAACPTGSLDHRAMTAGQCPPAQPDLALSADHTEHFLRSRRSIRAYKPKAADAELIERLIRMARYAPSGRNEQGVEWLVIARKEEVQGIGGLVADWMRWTIDHDPQTAAAMHLAAMLKCRDDGTDIIFRDAPAVIIAHMEKDDPRAQTTCTIALTYLELAATGLGLGCCWAGYFMRAAVTYPPLMQALGLPQGHKSFGAMMVGYPRFKYHRLPLRNEPKIKWRT